MHASSNRLSLAFSQIGHSYAHVFMLLYPTVVLALEGEFGMGYGELLVLMTLGNVLFGVAALPAGWLGDRWSTVGMMVVFFLGTGAAAILTGLMDSPMGLGAGLTLIGLFAAIYHPVGMAWLVRNAENRGRALGLNGVFGSLGVASASLIAGVLSDLIHWRAAFIVPGSVSVLTGLALWALMRSGRVRDMASDIKPQVPPARHAMVRAFIVLSVTMLCTGLVFQALSTAMPKVFAERMASLTGGSAAGAGLMVSLVYVFAMGGQLLGGHLADRYSLRNTYILLYVFQIPVMLIAASLSGPPVFLAVTMAVVLNTVGIPVENTLLSHYSPDKWRGTAFGAKFVLALGVSALAVPMVAYLRESTGGFYWYFMAMAALSLVVVSAGLALPGTRREVVAAPVAAPAPSAEA